MSNECSFRYMSMQTKLQSILCNIDERSTRISTSPMQQLSLAVNPEHPSQNFTPTAHPYLRRHIGIACSDIPDIYLYTHKFSLSLSLLGISEFSIRMRRAPYEFMTIASVSHLRTRFGNTLWAPEMSYMLNAHRPSPPRSFSFGYISRALYRAQRI